MKRLAIALVVIGLLIVSQVTQAANLEEGWYVKLGGVGILGYTPSVGPWNYEWDFVGGLGNDGPFVITSPDAFYPQRLVSVPQDTIGVAPGTSLYLWGKPMSPLPQNGIITGIGFHWETNYDAAVMRVDLLMCDPEQSYTTVWSQNKSGFHWGIPDVNISISPTTYQPAFRITVIPEASGLPVILAGFGILATRMRRSKS